MLFAILGGGGEKNADHQLTFVMAFKHGNTNIQTNVKEALDN